MALILPVRSRCPHCGAFETPVEVEVKTVYGNIPMTQWECHNPRCILNKVPKNGGKLE